MSQEKELTDVLPFNGPAKGLGIKERFTRVQLQQIHDLHEKLQLMGALSELRFDYGHRFCRATFLLTAPFDPGLKDDREIMIRMLLRFDDQNQGTYFVTTQIDGESEGVDYSESSHSLKPLSDKLLQIVEGRVVGQNHMVLAQFSALDRTASTGAGASGSVVFMSRWVRGKDND